MRPKSTFSIKNYSVFSCFLLVISGLLSGCEKVLDVDLKEAEPKVVIEATVSDQPGPYTVTITKSVSFSQPNVFPVVSGATVTLTDNTGNSETLLETEAGIYKTTSFQGIAGRNYFLKITAEGKNYDAVSAMPQPVLIKQLYLDKFQFNEEETVPKFKFQDPAGIKNFYRALYFVNGKMSKRLFFEDDEFRDGNEIEGTLFDQDMKLKSGDVVKVTLQSIDEANFNYLREEELSGSSQLASPANPTTNLTNGALGYFSALTESSATIVVP